MASFVSIFGKAAPRGRAQRRAQLAAELRPIYADLLRDGTERFFGPRRERCPSCDGRSLERLLTTPDVYQFKPGTFTLDRCGECGLVFQNPPLTGEGLGFYYRDFYDGLGAETFDKLFGGVDD